MDQYFGVHMNHALWLFIGLVSLFVATRGWVTKFKAWWAATNDLKAYRESRRARDDKR